TVTLRLEGAVVDGFGFLDLAMRPGTDQIRRCKTNTDFVEFRDLSLTFQHIQQVFQGQPSVQEPMLIIDSSYACGTAAGAQHGHCCPLSRYSFSSSMLMPSERISFSNTLKDSGMPGSMRWSPSTMFL